MRPDTTATDRDDDSSLADQQRPAPPASADGQAHEHQAAPAGTPPPDGQPATVEQLQRLLVETVRDYALFALDPAGYIVSWNPGAQRFKGYLAPEIIGKHFSVFYPPEDVAWGKPAYELEVAAREGRFEDEGWRVRKDGTRFWANVIITALRDSTGRLVGYGKITRDLTERRRAEEALRLSEERFRLLVQSVKDYGIFMLDPAGRIATWNEGAERINGYEVNEIIGQHFSIFYPPEDVALSKPARELETAVKDGRLEDEGWRVRKDGTRFWANVVITALFDPAGRLVGFAKVTRDLTEQRAAEGRAIADARRLAAQEAARAAAEERARELTVVLAQLREQAMELERRSAEAQAASRAKSEFLAAMSHELRTPLNAIGGYVDLLEMGLRGPVNDEQRGDLDRIRRSQRRLLALITDMLDLSRIEARQMAYDIASVRVGEALDAVEPMIMPQVGTKRLAYERAGGPTDATVLGDRGRFEQILLNLLSNAIKFTPAGGHVSVAWNTSPTVVEVHVRDTGVGVPADKLEAIFEPFVQADASLTRPAQGAGLGLAISRELARGMGGDITVLSAPGAGSTFTVRLPKG